MISRWCAGEPQTWTWFNQDTEEWEPHEVSPHQLCSFQRFPGHEHPSHRDCCWSTEEAESWDCTCDCHLEENARIAAKIAREDEPKVTISREEYDRLKALDTDQQGSGVS